MRLIALLLLILSACGGGIAPDDGKPSQLLSMRGYGYMVFSGVELPLMVYNDDPLLHSTTTDAVDTWNEWMGTEFLKVTSNFMEGEIFVFSGKDPRYNGLTQFIEVPLSERGNYRHDFISKVTMFTGSTETLVHELGHAVGLAHDPHNRRSIMHPYSMPRYMPILEARDLAVLKRVYLK